MAVFTEVEKVWIVTHYLLHPSQAGVKQAFLVEFNVDNVRASQLPI